MYTSSQGQKYDSAGPKTKKCPIAHVYSRNEYSQDEKIDTIRESQVQFRDVRLLGDDGESRPSIWRSSFKLDQPVSMLLYIVLGALLVLLPKIFD